MNPIKFCSFLILSNCIGVDHIDAPIVDARIELAPNTLSLVLGEERSISFAYFNNYGVEESVDFEWISRDETIVSFTSEGRLLANSIGQAYVLVTFEDLKDSALVTVVKAGSLIASVALNTPKTEIGIGEMV